MEEQDEKPIHDDSVARRFLISFGSFGCMIVSILLILGGWKEPKIWALLISQVSLIQIGRQKSSLKNDLSWDVPRFHLIGIIALNIVVVILMWLLLHGHPLCRPWLPLASFLSPCLSLLMLMPYRDKR